MPRSRCPCAAAPKVHRRPLRLGSNISDAFAEPWYGVDAGYLQRAGIDATLQIFAGSGATATALAAGAIDLGVIDAISIANAIAHGVPLVGLTASGMFRVDLPSSVLCVAKTSAIKAPRDLTGQLVSVPSLNSLTTVSIQAWLKRSGVDPSAVKFIEIPFGGVDAALAHGTVACGYIGEPLLSEALATDARQFAVPYVVFGPVSVINMWVARRDWVEQNRDLAKTVRRDDVRSCHVGERAPRSHGADRRQIRENSAGAGAHDAPRDLCAILQPRDAAAATRYRRRVRSNAAPLHRR